MGMWKGREKREGIEKGLRARGESDTGKERGKRGKQKGQEREVIKRGQEMEDTRREGRQKREGEGAGSDRVRGALIANALWRSVVGPHHDLRGGGRDEFMRRMP